MQAPARQLSRHMTRDGQVSLRSHLFGNRNKSVFRMWSQDILTTETYPLLALIGGALVGGSWFATRHLFASPNVMVNKMERSQTLKNNEAKAKRFVQHRDSIRRSVNMVAEPK